ncbi:TPA_asm: RNA-directed RNA polymerase [ssRNA phage Gerhypos.2_41]|uniref:RNA-directed RNA polymerase n=2 Tax=Norzivirales TaxID=2842247 RepID=A0A8S5KY03_9VIRU|nr:RNA-directed RNA polymerase [ssRNA phage Gerhypos.2_41]QDH90895.1 MAG: RNA-dependent RNA polymerase [Leviviridae sp.]DAD50051.1 TPA_asm: RNA-directed RNA polymerase [ssRNA phage Gerhypos.2_41]
MRDYAMVKQALKADLSRWLPVTYDEASFSTAQADSEGWNSQQVAAALQISALYKKLAPDGQTEAAIQSTLTKFGNLNATLSFVPPNEGDSESMAYMLSLFRDEIWKVTDFEIDGCNFDLEFIRGHFASGPGASRLANSRNFYTKFFDSNHSYTEPYVLALFRAAVAQSDTWVQALKAWTKSFRPVAVRGNTLFTVAKNSEISRTCCTEPLLNMLMQKALGAWLEKRMARLGINLAKQPDVNRALTKQGSVDGSFGTLDLSSASDSISVTLCEWALPPMFYKWLKLFRSQIVRYPDGREEELRMISTMGNGFTFPLETIIFACAVRAVYISKGVNPSFWSGPDLNAAVFGDDLIVRKDCFDSLKKLLVRLGFTVNESKSFNYGSFRESCGYDYWLGKNIRPVYVESLETPQDVYSSFNRLSRWSAENELPIGRTLYLLSQMARFLPVPFSEADDVGFKVPVSKAPIKIDERGWTVYRKIEPVTTAQKVPRDLEEAKSFGYRGYNPWGWEVTFLGGYAQNPTRTFLTPIDLTSQVVMGYDLINRRPYQGEVLNRRRRTGAIPYWDWLGAIDRGRFAPESYGRWEAAVASVF